MIATVPCRAGVQAPCLRIDRRVTDLTLFCDEQRAPGGDQQTGTPVRLSRANCHALISMSRALHRSRPSKVASDPQSHHQFARLACGAWSHGLARARRTETRSSNTIICR